MVLKKLQSLRSDKSPGPDKLHHRIFKELVKELTTSLIIIYNKCIDKGTMPSQWKEDIVTPIFKKEWKSDPSNYRPVSLTSVVCKVMERIISESILEHIDKLHHRIFKELAKELTTPLIIIYNKCIDKGTMTSQWKEDIVTPIFKKEWKSDPSNYRPVSLPSVVCKVMERIISESILEHVKSNWSWICFSYMVSQNEETSRQHTERAKKSHQTAPRNISLVIHRQAINPWHTLFKVQTGKNWCYSTLQKNTWIWHCQH